MRAWLVVMVFGALFVGAGVARSQAPSTAAPTMEHKPPMTPADLQWADAPPVFKKGAKMAVLYGDPSKAGALFIVRLKMPSGYKIMPHWHPTDENVTVISGSFAAGMGDTFDAKAKALPAGSFASMPAKMHHFASAKGETVVEVSAMGPFQITYVNPADDPSKQAAAK
jgi:quercetin dioxygenase-like cupin family protein